MINTRTYHRLLILLLVNFLLAANTLAADAIRELWSVEESFTMPESAVYDHEREQVFVSNVNKYAKDGNGFISRVSGKGSEVEKKWLTGLNSPTGLAVRGGLLYAVDYDELLTIDIEAREIVSRAVAPHSKPSLNDVAISDSGRVFVTGSSSASIYVLDDGKLITWLQDKTLLKHANGLYVDEKTLVFGGYKWLKFDIASKGISAEFREEKPSVIEIDGISSDGCGGYFITLIDDERLWQIDKNNTAQPVSDLSINGIDIDYFEGKLYVPVVGGGLRVFAVDSSKCAVH